jgi:sec-independent protein translocase protein TatC
VTVEKLKEIRPYFIVGAFIVGAIFTPPDVLSQFMLAVPMWLLYELGILMAQMIGKSSRADDGAYRPDGAAAESSTNEER